MRALALFLLLAACDRTPTTDTSPVACVVASASAGMCATINSAPLA